MSTRPLLRLLQPPTPSNPTSILTISLTVRPSTHPSRCGISDIMPSCVRVNVSAPAIDGRANLAAAEVIARTLGVAKTDVRVVKGARGRDKVVEVRMYDGDGVLERVRGMLEGGVMRRDQE